MPQQPRSKVISASITVPIAVKAVILICYVDLPNPFTHLSFVSKNDLSSHSRLNHTINQKLYGINQKTSFYELILLANNLKTLRKHKHLKKMHHFAS